MANEHGNADMKMHVQRDATDWPILMDVVTDPLTRAWIVDGLQRKRWYDDIAMVMVATVTLTVEQWHVVLSDINGLGHCQMARLLNIRDAIVFALRYGPNGVPHNGVE